jgi:hypothetical protein
MVALNWSRVGARRRGLVTSALTVTAWLVAEVVLAVVEAPTGLDIGVTVGVASVAHTDQKGMWSTQGAGTEKAPWWPASVVGIALLAAFFGAVLAFAFAEAAWVDQPSF